MPVDPLPTSEAMVADHERIWLEPPPGGSEGRLWCQDKVWPMQPEDGEPTEYVRADIHAAALALIERQAAELAGLRQAYATESRAHQITRSDLEAEFEKRTAAEAELALSDGLKRIAEAHAEAAEVNVSDLQDDLAAAEAELARLRGDGWQDISTAPRDGTRILAWGFPYGPSVRIVEWGSGRYLGRKKGYEQGWSDHPGHTCEPTLWMPLPDPSARETLTQEAGNGR